MFTFTASAGGPSANRDCQNVARRDFLRWGAGGLGGGLLGALADGPWAEAAAPAWRGTSVVFLFLCGGPSHIETFDPNMTAPAPCSSLTGETPTTLPGVTFGGTFPKLAALAHRLAVTRSYAPHDISDHAKAIHHVFRGGDPLGVGASLGAMSALADESAAPSHGMPLFGELIDDEIDSQYQEDMQRMRSANGSGQLGARRAPFDARGGGGLLENLTPRLPLETLRDRAALTARLDNLRREFDARGAFAAHDEHAAAALELLASQRVRRALDLALENPRVLARYDTSRFSTGYLAKRPSTLGRNLLLARRLCEAGCRFVTVGSAGWDNHGNGNHPGVVEGMDLLGRPLDHAVSAFLEDVAARGLEEKILLVITGEFGRTPRIQANGGRDHWPGLCALVFAGGGLKMGQVIGRSARGADVPASDPHRLEHLVGTLLRAQFDVSQLRLQPALPRDLARLLETAPVIPRLF